MEPRIERLLRRLDGEITQAGLEAICDALDITPVDARLRTKEVTCSTAERDECAEAAYNKGFTDGCADDEE